MSEREKLTEQPAAKSSAAVPGISLYVIAIALAVTYYGEIKAAGGSDSGVWQTVRLFFFTAILWWVNADIASYLKRIFVSEQSGEPLAAFRFNYWTVVAMGVCEVINCFNLGEEGIIGIIFTFVYISASVCWIVSQILISVKLISKGGGLTGGSIIAYVAAVIASATALSSLSFKHNEVTFYVMYGIMFTVSMLMYAAYKNYFNNINKH